MWEEETDATRGVRHHTSASGSNLDPSGGDHRSLAPTDRLTQERGDDAAAELAATVARLVRRSSVQHGGKPIKWLGDGVMFYFADPGQGTRSALQMVDGLAAAGLPPARAGLHSGPVLFREGDYFGQTVNVTARIAEYARQSEVLVSQAVADASQEEGLAFGDIGPVELKGVSGTVHLLRAHLA
jgi:class 3 adenylate cyclase